MKKEVTMPKKLFYIFIALSIMTSVLTAANNFEKKDLVYFGPGAGEITIGPKQTAVIRYGWVNCSKGLTQDWIDHSVFKLTLYKEGVLLTTVSMEKGYWIWEDPTPGDQCLHGNESIVARWHYALVELKDPGTYNLQVHRETTVPMIDGWDYDADGLPDIFPAQVWSEHWVTIHVLDK
jgi:hypothetical protein